MSEDKDARIEKEGSEASTLSTELLTFSEVNRRVKSFSKRAVRYYLDIFGQELRERQTSFNELHVEYD